MLIASSVWTKGRQRVSGRTDRTYVEDLEDSGELLSPSKNLVFISPWVEEMKGRVPFALFDDLLPYRGYSSVN